MYQAKFGARLGWDLVLIVTGWTLYAVLFASQSYIQLAYAGKSRGFRDHFVPWLICSALWAMLTPLVLRLATRFPLITRTKWSYGLVIHVPAAVALSLFQLALFVFVRQSILGTKPGTLFEQYKGLIVEEFHAGLLIYFVILAIGRARDYLFKNSEDRALLARGLAEKSDYTDAEETSGSNDAWSGRAPSRLNGSRIVVKENGRTFFVDPSDIQWINSEGNYVKLHTSRKRYLIRATMKAMEKSLDKANFARIRRSAIVQISHIAELRPGPNGGSEVILKNGVVLYASRRYRKNLETFPDSR